MKLFFIIISFLLSITIGAQNNDYYKQKISRPEAIPYIKWTIQEPRQWGSFWLKVERTVKQNNGYYYFYIYLSSNSYFNERDYYGNYKKAISYIDNINFTMRCYNSPYYVNLPYQLVDWKNTYVAYFYCTDPNPTFKVTYDSVTPYDVSKQ